MELKTLDEVAKLVETNLRDNEVDLLRRMFLVYHMTIVDRPLIPPTREELLMVGITKKILGKFEKCGLCETKTRIVTEKGRGTVGRVTVCLTEVGERVCETVLAFKKPVFKTEEKTHPLNQK